MQLFDRKEVDVPAGLLSDRAKKARFEVLKLFQMSESARAQTKVPVESLHNLGDSIQNALDQLFHGKCAFCESKIRGSIDVYRFRPASDSLPADDEGSQHLYYGWLSLVWENLYPICSDCNNRDNFFPVSGHRVQLPSLAALRLCIDDGSWAEYPIQENSLLIDPCGTRKPRTSIIFHANGIFSPKNKLGKLTIEKFNLNRPKLVARRGKMMLHYVKLLKGYATAERERQPGVAERVPRIFDFKRLEFGGMWHGFLLQVCADLLGLSPSLLRRMDVDFWGVYRNHPDGASFRRRIRQAVFKRMGRDDPRVEQREESTSKNPGRFVSLKLHNFKSIEALEVKMPRSSQPRSNGTPALLILGRTQSGKVRCWRRSRLG